MKKSFYPFTELSQTIQLRHRKAIRKRDICGYALNTLAIILLMAVAVAFFINSYHFRFVEGNDMFPTLHDSDLTLCTEKSEYKKNDIVFYEYEGKEYIGRVVAKGGDTVRITVGGELIVNGTTQTGEIIYPTYPPEKKDIQLDVPEGTVYILGDLRTQSEDSRLFGCIPLSDVPYKVMAMFRHRTF